MNKILTMAALASLTLPSVCYAKCEPAELEQLLRKGPYTSAFNEFQVSAGFAYGAWVTKYDELKLSNDQKERSTFLNLGKQYMSDATKSVQDLYSVAASLPSEAYCRNEMMSYIKKSGEDMVQFHNQMIAEFVK
ncbi:hypothetical protein [Alteromonas gracilis]|uniref:hypothetical protein n=1 Tax=Alteromonas gracilis TaxID=1479524 RepID=UPI00373700F1